MRAGAHPSLLRTVLLCSSGLQLRRPALLEQHRRHVHPWLAQEMAAFEAQKENHSSLGELPDFRGPSRLLKDAYKQSVSLVPNSKLPNAKKRATKHAAQKIDAYTQALSVTLRENLKAFRSVMGALPPFQEQLAQLTLAALEREGGRSLRQVEQDFDLLRRAVVRAGKEASAEASKAPSA